jgi:hypothetical protein
MRRIPMLIKTIGLTRYSGNRFPKKEAIRPWISGKLRKVSNARMPRKTRAPKNKFARGQTLKFNTKPRETRRKIKAPA